MIRFLMLIMSVLSLNFAMANEISLDSPRATMKSYLELMAKVKDGETKYLKETVTMFDLSQISEATKQETGMLVATQLINTLDRLERIDIETIPEKVESKKWIFRKTVIQFSGKNKSVEISMSKSEEKKWLFSKETVSSISAYEEFLKNRKIVSGVTELRDWKTPLKELMPAWTGETFFLIKTGQWMALFAIIFLALFIMLVIRKIISHYILEVFKAKGLSFDNLKHKSFFTTLEFLTFIFTVYFAVRALELPDKALSIIFRICYVSFAFLGTIICLQLVNICSSYFEKLAERTENKFDDILIPLLGRGTKVLVVAIGIVMIGHALTVNVTNIIAGLGIGGLAVAFAAKDTLSNFFGSLTVVMDRPFQIGDWVALGNGVEGVVEKVGFRSTRIRTFYDSQTTVPNNQLINIHIDNYGKRKFRRFSTKIDIQYDTPSDKIEAFCEGIRQIIVKHPHTRKDYFHVYLNNLGPSSLQILVYVFWVVGDWSEELNERHRLLIDILRLGKELGVDFAFPTQTLHLFNEEKAENLSIDDDEYFKKAEKVADQVIESPLTPISPRSKAEQGNKLAPFKI